MAVTWTVGRLDSTKSQGSLSDVVNAIHWRATDSETVSGVVNTASRYLMIQSNVIHSAYIFGVKKLLFLGSSCIYPKFAKIPITEDQLLTGSLEPSNDSYAIAKIAGIKMCQAYRKQFGFNAVAVMPTNLYGPNDNFDHNYGHVLPSLIAKFHGSKEKSEHWVVKLWGDGSPKREFLHVDDLAEALNIIIGEI